MSNQHESLDCNLYRCEACIPSRAEDDEVKQSYPEKRKATVLKLQSSSDDVDDAAMATDLVMITDLVGNNHPPANPSLVKRNQLKAKSLKKKNNTGTMLCGRQCYMRKQVSEMPRMPVCV